MTTTHVDVHTSHLGVARTALAGAAVLFVLFAVCWAATAFSGLAVTHMFVSLFTPQPVSSVAALMEGSVWSLAFGAFAGALVAVFFNVFRVGSH